MLWRCCLGIGQGTEQLACHPFVLHRYKGKFEFTYVSKNAVIVKTLANGNRTVLKSGQAAAVAAAVTPTNSTCCLHPLVGGLLLVV